MQPGNTHVYAVVRVKLAGTPVGDDPLALAQQAADAVRANLDSFLSFRKSAIEVGDLGTFEVQLVEFADELRGVLVDEIDPKTECSVRDHYFESGEL